jgi:hypothetical protein
MNGFSMCEFSVGDKVYIDNELAGVVVRVHTSEDLAPDTTGPAYDIKHADGSGVWMYYADDLDVL